MIAQLSGKLIHKQPNTVIIDVGGVGYDVTIPVSTFYELGEPGADVSLKIHTHVREDTIQLFGFWTGREKELFLKLTSVSGVGPKIGIALLSSLGVERGARALREKNIGLLSSVNGIGKKTAERMALELGEKVEDFTAAPSITVPPDAEAALKALERLGYATAEADRAVRQVLSGNGTDAGETEALVRRALQILTTR